MSIGLWWRAALIFLGLAGLGSGGTAVFVTHLEAGPVALLAVGLVLLLVGAGGRLPSRLRVGDNEAAWEAVQEYVAQTVEDAPPGREPSLLGRLSVLAERAPAVAAAALAALAYRGMALDMLARALADLAPTLGESILDTSPTLDEQGIDAKIITPTGRSVGVQITAVNRDLTPEDTRQAINAHATLRLDAFLIVSRYSMTMDAAILLDNSAAQLKNSGIRIFFAQVAGTRDEHELRREVERAIRQADADQSD
jgi:hypothetical protein